MPNLILVAPQTPVIWTSGGTPDLDLNGLAADAVRVGQQLDRGAGSIPQWFEWFLHIDGFNTAPVVGETVDSWFAFSDGTNIDGEVGAADAPGTTPSLRALHFLGSNPVLTTTAGDNLNTSGKVRITSRFVSPVTHNNTADALLSAAAHSFTLIPVPQEIQ